MYLAVYTHSYRVHRIACDKCIGIASTIHHPPCQRRDIFHRSRQTIRSEAVGMTAMNVRFSYIA